MSVGVKGYGGSGGGNGLGNLMSLFNMGKSVGGDDTKDWSQTDAQAKQGYADANNMLGQGQMLSLPSTGADDQFMASLDAIKRRQGTVVGADKMKPGPIGSLMSVISA